VNDQQLRILHVCCTDSFAGVERHIASLACEQAKRGNEVQIIGGDPALMPGRLSDPELDYRPARSLLQAVRAMRHLPRPTVINTHMTAAEVAAAVSVHNRGVPVVSTRHFAHRRGARRAWRPLVRVTARRIGAEIAVSNYVAGSIESGSIVVHSGVPARPDAPLARQRSPVILMAQRLEAEKATHLGIEAFAASGLSASGWRLQIAGGGTLHDALQRQAADRGVGHAVDFLGQRNDVETLMRSASILIAPRPDEGYGLTVLEAMANGLPVVASRSGGHMETVGVLPDASLFEPHNGAKAGHLLAMLALDPTARDAYGSALQALQRKSFTVSGQAAATEAVYRSML
jgi:glycosyltransferase involved in cell wall biosynthesis